MSKRVITDEDILNLSPGRDLDAQIALRVMGFKEITIVGTYYFTDPIDTQLKSYSTDIKAAWEVVEKLRKQKIYLDIRVWPNEYQVLPHYDENNKLKPELVVKLRSLPEAICKAAFLSVIGGFSRE
ncbi:hypothetical protein ACFSVM_25745 [Paenibacillus shunpengii]|uniref:Phage ABA sandwich domain-containing protein n=1 Tax=Paenibacillus shunpengii TaxID=2054424 RepID=A0ABW5SX11_9BACL